MASTPLQRLQGLVSQIKPSETSLLSSGPEDIVITCALRTPLTKARKGGLKDTRVEDLIISVLESIKAQSKIDVSLVEDVCVGNVLAPGNGYIARSSVLAAGFPVTTAASAVNRFCSSGLLAIQLIANSIQSGAIDVGIAVGAESMSSNPDDGAPNLSKSLKEHPIAKDNMMPMGWTAENVAGDFNISREAQDAFAAQSFQKAKAAQDAGWTAEEIAPITTTWTNPKTGEYEHITVAKDDGIRPGVSAESLSKIRKAFPQWPPSTTTGGNASQITDGAAGVLLMKRKTAERLGQKIMGRFVMTTVAGLEPRIMGIGPTLAIPKLLQKVGMTLDDIDIVEINEAFSSMGVYCLQKLNLDLSKLNPRGGAVALGHPLGCTGVRQVVTILSELKRQGRKYGITSMCVGTGMGMAGLFVSEQ